VINKPVYKNASHRIPEKIRYQGSIERSRYSKNTKLTSQKPMIDKPAVKPLILSLINALN
jgi:hypothetical protein